MRILWHSAAPWEPTGYGQQTAIWTRRMQRAGHQVAISAYHGVAGLAVEWEGMPVFPAPLGGPVHDLLRGNADEWKPDLIICLADMWIMNPRIFGQYRTAAWLPVDSAPLSVGDTSFLMNSAVQPVAMSLAGQAAMAAAGFQAPYVPHGIDTTVFRLDPRRADLRAAYGIGPDTFAVGINANNIDAVRKAYPEQMWAFAEFHKKHPDSVLLVHSIVAMPSSLNLELLAVTLGIRDCVRFADQYRMESGRYPADEMARWYGALDVLMNATYGEGFGIPIIEAQACGTPVIVSDGSSGPQLKGPGWAVRTEPYWNRTHGSWWHRPSVHGLERALGKALAGRGQPMLRQACRANAVQYDVESVWPKWEEVLSGLG